MIDGRSTPLEVRESVRARRMTLRVDPADGLVRVVVPAGLAEAEVRGFIARHTGWIAGRLAALPPRLPFCAGAEVPILGVPHVIRTDPARAGRAEIADGAITVGGAPEHTARRVRDLLIREARRQVVARAADKAARLGVAVRRVTVRDTRSRWGSCGANGRLSFSWRLLLTPEPVFDYVVAHEVAHLREMNHSARFWALVATLTDDVDGARNWLRRNGARLFRYGGPDPGRTVPD